MTLDLHSLSYVYLAVWAGLTVFQGLLGRRVFQWALLPIDQPKAKKTLGLSIELSISVISLFFAALVTLPLAGLMLEFFAMQMVLSVGYVVLAGIVLWRTATRKVSFLAWLAPVVVSVLSVGSLVLLGYLHHLM